PSPDFYTLSLHDALPIFLQFVATAHPGTGGPFARSAIVGGSGRSAPLISTRGRLGPRPWPRIHPRARRAPAQPQERGRGPAPRPDRKSTRLNSSHVSISY